MKSKKILILAVTISFPVLLYLFLRFFGQNSYDLPVYFQQEGIACHEMKGEIKLFKSSIPSDTFSIQEVFTDQLNLIIFPNINTDNQPLKNELSRVVQNLSTKVDLRIIGFYTDSVNTNNMFSISDLDIINYKTSVSDYQCLINCHFKLPNTQFLGDHPAEEEWSTSEIVMLLDEGQNIRGYYNGFETKEIDRLILEINVLLSKR